MRISKKTFLSMLLASCLSYAPTGIWAQQESIAPEPAHYGMASYQDVQAPAAPVPAEEPFVELYSDCCDGGGLPLSWARVDYLLWWTSGNDLPPLVTTSTAGTAAVNAGRIGLNTTSVLFGGTEIDDDARSGVRVDVGHWLDDCGYNGLQVVYFSVFDDGSSGDFTGASNTNAILAFPFFDTTLNNEQAFLASFPGLVGGQVNVSSSSELHSASVLLRSMYAENYYSRVDLIGGYRYFRFREGLNISQDITTLAPVGAFATGTRVQTTDRFTAENDFHGGELGAAFRYWDGFWSVETTAKVAIGNVRREVSINGNSTVTTGPASVSRQGGIFTQASNIGSRSDNEFAALPEIGINLNLALTDCVSATVGYTGLYLNDVFRTGSQIDRSVDPTQFFGGAAAARPAPVIGQDDDFWAHGLNFGVTIER